MSSDSTTSSASVELPSSRHSARERLSRAGSGRRSRILADLKQDSLEMPSSCSAVSCFTAAAEDSARGALPSTGDMHESLPLPIIFRSRSLLFTSPLALMWHRGVLELLCSSCRYVVRRWHVPILGVDCNANPRHKQALTSPPPRSRGIPKHLTPYLVGKQAPRHPRWRQDHMLRARATHLYRATVRRNG
ncbi:hypothetical protein Esti_000090 [Eimeria stiedai]